VIMLVYGYLLENEYNVYGCILLLNFMDGFDFKLSCDSLMMDK
jgi:hypothetical protein